MMRYRTKEGRKTIQKGWGLGILLVFMLLMPLSSSASTYTYRRLSRVGAFSIPAYTAAFPGLANGTARLSPNRIELSFPYAANRESYAKTESPIQLSGRALRLPIEYGFGNEGSLSVLFDKPGEASGWRDGRLLIQWEGELPAQGKRIRIGEAVVATVRQPLYYERLSLRAFQPVVDASRVYAVANRLDNPASDLLPAGHIVRVTLWLENHSDRLLSVTLGGSPSPVEGSLVDPDVSEALRYVSSDSLLPQGYAPSLYWTRNLSCIRNGQAYAFRREVVFALRSLLRDAEANRVALFQLDNSYRSAAWQEKLFERRLRLSAADPTITDPMAATLRRVTRPNGSEHQTGMAFDMYATTAREAAFGNTPEYDWLHRHGWKYGFVVRYPVGTEHLTGVMYEPWHIRWFGRPVASWLYREKRVYEELVAEVLGQGSLWLGSVEMAETGAAASRQTGSSVSGGTGLIPVDDMAGIVWLAIPATADAVYASANSAYAPEISHFLSDRHMWLIPMGEASTVTTSP